MLRTVVMDDVKERWKFRKNPDSYSSEERSKVMSLLIECLVKITFESHLYLWKGQIRKQKEGGPIGLRATGSCAKVVMDDWLKKFREKLEEQGIEVYLITKYVDDVLVVARNVPLGSYWNGDHLDYSKEVEDKHLHSKMDRSVLTLDILRQLANSVSSFLKFTGEASINGRPIPCLDAQIWVGPPSADGKWYQETEEDEEVPGKLMEDQVEYNTVLYKFYKKPMAAKLTTLARSAAPERSKVATAVAEVLRRWKNTSTLISRREFEEVSLTSVMTYQQWGST